MYFAVVFAVIYAILFASRIVFEQPEYTDPETGKHVRAKLELGGLLYAFVWPFLVVSVLIVFAFNGIAPIVLVFSKQNYNTSKIKAVLDRYTEYVLQ